MVAINITVAIVEAVMNINLLRVRSRYNISHLRNYILGTSLIVPLTNEYPLT